MWRSRGGKQFIQFVEDYLATNALVLDDKATYFPGLDCAMICIDDNPVLIVGTRNEPEFTIRETEFTDRYLRKPEPISA